MIPEFVIALASGAVLLSGTFLAVAIGAHIWEWMRTNAARKRAWKQWHE